MELKVHYVYANSIHPYPAQINLADTQTVLLRSNKFCFSPYTTHEYSVTLTGFSKGQEMDLQLIDDVTTPDLPQLKARVEKEASLFAYGPIKSIVPAYAVRPVGFSYDHNRPITLAVRLDRAFWLPASDVDVVQTEDYDELVNDGAELKSGFSWSEWMLGRYELMNRFALSQLEFPIDPKAPFTNYYFTGKVGMVTSHKQTKSCLAAPLPAFRRIEVQLHHRSDKYFFKKKKSLVGSGTLRNLRNLRNLRRPSHQMDN